MWRIMTVSIGFRFDLAFDRLTATANGLRVEPRIDVVSLATMPDAQAVGHSG
jgi:hypothetical protein